MVKNRRARSRPRHHRRLDRHGRSRHSPQRRHPWREQVNHRLANLNQASTLNGAKASWRREDRAIRRQERFMAE
jgi:hypothetical protein